MPFPPIHRHYMIKNDQVWKVEPIVAKGQLRYDGTAREREKEKNITDLSKKIQVVGRLWFLFATCSSKCWLHLRKKHWVWLVHFAEAAFHIIKSRVKLANKKLRNLLLLKLFLLPSVFLFVQSWCYICHKLLPPHSCLRLHYRPTMPCLDRKVGTRWCCCLADFVSFYSSDYNTGSVVRYCVLLDLCLKRVLHLSGILKKFCYLLF